MYHAGVRFDVGDLINFEGKSYIYLGEDEDLYSVFCGFDDYPRLDIKRLIVRWNSTTVIAGARLPRLSSIRAAIG